MPAPVRAADEEELRVRPGVALLGEVRLDLAARPLPSSASWAQRPRYSTRIQWSTRLAVAASGSAKLRETSEQNSLRCCSGIRLLRDARRSPGRS